MVALAMAGVTAIQGGLWSREEGSGEGSGRLWCRARSGSTGFRRRFRKRAMVQSHVRFNRVSEKVPEKWEALVQSHVRFNRVPEKVPEKGYGAEPCQVQQGFGEGSGEVGGFGAEPR